MPIKIENNYDLRAHNTFGLSVKAKLSALKRQPLEAKFRDFFSYNLQLEFSRVIEVVVVKVKNLQRIGIRLLCGSFRVALGSL